MLVVVMSAEEEYDAANEHETCKYGFAPMAEYMLYAFCLCAHQERNTEQHVRRQFAENEHESVGQHLAAVVDFLVYIADGGYAGHQCAGVEDG